MWNVRDLRFEHSDQEPSYHAIHICSHFAGVVIVSAAGGVNLWC
jgi:hypothetical protein